MKHFCWSKIVDIKADVLTESGQFESIGSADQIDKGLQLKATSCYIQIVIKHRKFEGWLHFIGALFENCAWNETKIWQLIKNCWVGKFLFDKFNEFWENEVNKPLNDFFFFQH